MTKHDDSIRIDPKERVKQIFIELRQLCQEGYATLVRDEICYLTNCYLHAEDGSDCVGSVRELTDYHIFSPNEDVVEAHLSSPEGELTERGCEAIVRRLATQPGPLEVYHFNGWLQLHGFEPLRRSK